MSITIFVNEEGVRLALNREVKNVQVHVFKHMVFHNKTSHLLFKTNLLEMMTHQKKCKLKPKDQE